MTVMMDCFQKFGGDFSPVAMLLYMSSRMSTRVSPAPFSISAIRPAESLHLLFFNRRNSQISSSRVNKLGAVVVVAVVVVVGAAAFEADGRA